MLALSVSHVLLALAVFARGKIIPYNLKVANSNVSPDGFRRSAITLNGITPGPILTAYKGDDLRVVINNTLSDHNMRVSTTVHWHGILQPRTAYDDGPAFVTQCPIAPGHSYPYTIETSDQAGTFWYHSHLSSQYIDGLRGALIIYDPHDPYGSLYDVDDESTVISLTDWYHDSAEKLGHDWIAGTKPEPVPDANLMNGLGRYKGGPATPRAVLNVVQGKRYRFRIINMSAIVPFNFSIEGHQVTIIEVDGVNHKPFTVTSLSISAGQRYSVVLNANQPKKNYWVSYPSNFREIAVPGSNPIYNGTEAFGILRYKGAPKADPTTPQFIPDNKIPLVEYKLKPLSNPPKPTDKPMLIDLNFAPVFGGDISTPGGANVWLVNNVTYTAPTLPTLLEILSNTNKNNQSDFLNEDVYVLPINRTIDVRLIGDEHHPFHLHGHTFQVIQSAEGPRNEINPPIRDTVDTNNGFEGSTPAPVTIRFRTDNPGPWFLHCHKDWHLEAGLAVVFAEDPADQRMGPKSIKPSPEWKKLCDIYNGLPAGDK